MSTTDDDSPLGVALPLDGRPGPATRISRKRADELVNAALDASPLVPPVARRKRGPAVLVAAGVAIAASAAAATLVALRPAAPVAATATTPSTTEKTTSPPRGAPSPEPATAPAPGATAPATTGAEPGADGDEPSAPPPAVRTAEDWLEKANALRSRGRFAEAERAYSRVFGQYPGTLSAYVARVAAGQLRVDHLGDPDGARRLFQAALRASPGGALDLEARQGLAEASRRIGDTEGERAALRGIVERYPKSRAATLARERLSAR